MCVTLSRTAIRSRPQLTAGAKPKLGTNDG
jgi:hypothetical protein